VQKKKVNVAKEGIGRGQAGDLGDPRRGQTIRKTTKRRSKAAKKNDEGRPKKAPNNVNACDWLDLRETPGKGFNGADSVLKNSDHTHGSGGASGRPCKQNRGSKGSQPTLAGYLETAARKTVGRGLGGRTRET